MVPRVLHDTTSIAVQYVPAPIAGTVLVGTGAVSDFPTHGIPMPNLSRSYSGWVCYVRGLDLF